MAKVVKDSSEPVQKAAEVTDTAKIKVDSIVNRNNEGEDPGADDVIVPDVSSGLAPEPSTVRAITEPSADEAEEPEPAPVPSEETSPKTVDEVERLKAENRGFIEAQSRLRKKIREMEAKELTAAAVPVVQEDKLKPLRDKYGDISQYEEIVEGINQAKGYVRKDVAFQDSVQQNLNEWLEEHPDYLPKNDPDNVRWDRFKEMYGLYRPPQTIKELKTILNRVNADIVTELGMSPYSQEEKKIAAQHQKIRSVSHAGGTKAEPVKATGKPLPSQVLQHFKGFTPEDFE